MNSKWIATFGMVGLLAVSTAQAASEEQERGAIGFGIGMLIGGAVAGPPGAIIGSALGGTIATGNYLETELDVTRDEVAQTRATLKSRSAELAASRDEVSRLKQQQMVAEQNLATMRKVALTRPARPSVPLLAGALELAIHFRTNSKQIESHYGQPLRTLSAFASVLPGARIELIGHADPRGSDLANETLAEARVAAVRRALVAHGVGAEMITSFALGERAPISASDDREAWPFDRRVEIRVLADGDALQVKVNQ